MKRKKSKIKLLKELNEKVDELLLLLGNILYENLDRRKNKNINYVG